MTFMQVPFLIFLIGLIVVFYIVPLKARWIVLLIGSVAFYFVVCNEAFPILIVTILISYFAGRLIYAVRDTSVMQSRVVLAISIIIIVSPLFMIKEGNFILSKLFGEGVSLIVPLGVSFYTLQIISYFVDIYKHKIEPEKNVFRFALYISYFPQIIQGPIPRFDQLNEQLKIHKSLDEKMFIKGFQLILWGWFLKLVIADKSGIIVDTVFNSPDEYKGMYVFVAGVLYSIQLYTDFQACVCIAKGISELFGIELVDNFDHPYFSQSVSEFWRRWHISFSSWLRDYIYIPLGGNRKGTLRKYVNLIITFVVSGIWHGTGYKYIFWGIMHAGYQIVGAVTEPIRKKTYEILHIKQDDKFMVVFRMIFTFICVMLAWIIFRANSLHEGIEMILSLFTTWNPWILFNDSLFALGLSWKECVILLFAILLLIVVSYSQQYGSIRERILKLNIVAQFLIYLALIVIIMVFGTYGVGFNAKDFIYGGF